MEKKNIISFGILDGLRFIEGPYHEEIANELTDEKIQTVIGNLIKPFRNDYTKDHSSYFNEEFFENEESYLSTISENLIKNRYFVINRYNKYYVIAFAVNFTRFEIYSKDSDKELIKWRDNDIDDPIKGLIDDEDYNENPVLKLLKTLNK